MHKRNYLPDRFRHEVQAGHHMLINKGITAAIYENQKSYLCMSVFNANPDGSHNERTKVVYARGATPRKAARNLIKIIPRRYPTYLDSLKGSL